MGQRDMTCDPNNNPTVRLDDTWPGLTAGPMKKIDPQAITDFAD